MILNEPKFLNSPYFVAEPFNWYLKDGAPKEVKKEFENYMKQLNFQNEIKTNKN